MRFCNAKSHFFYFQLDYFFLKYYNCFIIRSYYETIIYFIDRIDDMRTHRM